MTVTAEPAGRWRALSLAAAGQLLVLTLWFSASAAAPLLELAWQLDSGQVAWLTLAVQIGFVAGALGLAIGGVADAVPARALFISAALAGAGLNALLLTVGPNDVTMAMVIRFLTGVTLAGVYPAGLKVLSGWFRRGRGLALGILVGALTVGSAGPHLIRGLGFAWQGVLGGASLLAALGALLMTGITDGPYETVPQAFSWRKAGVMIRNRGVRLSSYGYFGHMWELYGMWTWTLGYLAASAAEAGTSDGWVPTATFAIIGIGGAGSIVAGLLADRRGRTPTAGGAMVVSGTCALLTPLVFGLSPWAVVPLFLVWGFSVVADSAQFSTMVTETAPPEERGTALTLQLAIGFLITVITIRGIPVLAEAWGWRWAFPLLALGPVAGVAAMVRLRRSPEAALLAGGKG